MVVEVVEMVLLLRHRTIHHQQQVVQLQSMSYHRTTTHQPLA
jgi:hypothetical protein